VAVTASRRQDPVLADAEGLAQRIDALLARQAQGESGAMNELLELLYPDLRAMACAAMKDQPAGHTLQPTALVHEVYLKLARSKRAWESEAHLRSVLASAMRCVLADHARRKGRLRRAPPGWRVDLDSMTVVERARGPDLAELDDALRELAVMYSLAAQVVELRFFGGYTVNMTAKVLGVHRCVVRREWAWAQAWLRAKLA
jgi:RNA polymerase sigma-70 factor, ECF subfamily